MIDLFSCSYLLRKKIEIQYNNNTIKSHERRLRTKRSQDWEEAIHFKIPHVCVFIERFKKYKILLLGKVHMCIERWADVAGISS